MIVIQIRLVGKESVPEIRLGHGIPRPVGFFGVGEDDAGVLIFLIGVAPHVVIAFRRPLGRLAGALKPGMLIGGVIHHQLDHDLQPALVRGGEEGAKSSMVPYIGWTFR